MKLANILLIDHMEGNNLKERLETAPNITVIGSTNNMDIGYTLAERHQPDIIILNVDLPGNEGIAAAEVFALEFPRSSLVLMTASDSKRVLRYALRVGAKDVINLPIDNDKLFRLLSRVALEGKKRQEIYVVEKKTQPQFKTITIFSTKGGVGKTTVSLNLAMAIRQITKKRTVLVDLNLMAGNIALMAGVSAKISIKELIDDINNVDKETLDNYCVEHPSGLRILPAPTNPELATFVDSGHVEKVLELLSQTYNYVIIDAPNYFHDTVIPALEKADDILIVTTLDLASIQTLKQCIDLLAGMNIRNKTGVIINRMGYTGGLKVRDLEEELGMAAECIIPNTEKMAINAVNMGVPFFISDRNSQVGRIFEDLARKVVADEEHVKSKFDWRKILAR